MRKMLKAVWYDRIDRMIVVVGLTGFMWGYTYKDYDIPFLPYIVVGVAVFYVMTPVFYYMDLAFASIDSITGKILGIKKSG